MIDDAMGGDARRDSDPDGREPIRVVVVDDHQMLADSLRQHFQAQGDLVCLGTTGHLAGGRRLVEACRPDVLLLDHRLPDGDGVAEVAAFKQQYPDMAVVMITANPTDDVLLDAVRAGAAGLVSKSRSLGDLTAVVRAAAAGESVLSSHDLARIVPRLGAAGRDAAPEGAQLTDREHEVLTLLAEGLTNAAIASRLMVSVHTVRNHVANLSSKLGAHSKVEALSVAIRRGLLPAD